MNNKKITILFIGIACLLLVGIGLTFAYFTSTTDFENEFNTALFQTESVETFTSPQNWMPGDETPKTLTITNTGDVDVKARVCISEVWESDNGDTLPNEQNGERVAILNLDNTSDWTKKGRCYEYNDTLEPDDTTSSFIESVTFNPNVDLDITCTTTTSNGSTTKTCSSTGDGYDNATYTLILTVETIQANKANEVWNPIQYINRQNNNAITVGDEIAIEDEHFYVVSSDSNETVLLAKYNLLVGDVFDYDDNTGNYTLVKTLSSSDTGYGLQSSSAKGWLSLETNETTARYTGTVAFSGTNYWNNSECGYTGTNYDCTGSFGLLPEFNNYESYPYVYRSNVGNIISPQVIYISNHKFWSAQNNGYTISYYVEAYKNKLIELGVPSTITGRLLSQEEAVNLGCSESDYWCSPLDDENNSVSGTAPSWVYSTSYWLGSVNYDNDYIWYITSGGDFNQYNFYVDNYYGVRPVIVIDTSDL